MSARTAAVPLARRGAPRTRRSSRDKLAFTEPGALLVAVCGLHGGAGTTALTCLLASSAAAASPAGRVLAIEADPCAAELAGRLGVSSELSLNGLASLRARDAASASAPVTQRGDGLRVLASARTDLADPPPAALAALLAEARAAHALCVVDAGCVRHPAAHAALAGADVVVWTARAARLRADAFASPLVRPARGARWALALAVERRRPADRAALRSLRQELAAIVVVSERTALEGAAGRALAGRLARAVRA